MKSIIRVLVIFIAVLLVAALATLTIVDRSPYKDQDFYSETIVQFQKAPEPLTMGDTLLIGWAQSDLTPTEKLPLAGYGARDPKIFDDVHDSVAVYSYVIDNGSEKVAFLTADLLIIHPEVTRQFHALLEGHGWDPSKVYLSATHTHSSIGSWAPGFVGNLFAGAYDTTVVNMIAEKMLVALLGADQNKRPGAISFAEVELPDYVKNRLIKKNIGAVDPWLKLLFLRKDTLRAVHSVYSAHATCLSYHTSDVSGDYPAALTDALESGGVADFATYSAGAVASMGPGDTGSREWTKAEDIGEGIASQIELMTMISLQSSEKVAIRAFRLPVEMREPNFKISENLCVRPWVFRGLFGDYPAEISVLQLNDILFVGTPSDFSGELATPLYEYARSHGLNLIITSFNGGYVGYIPKDEWYDMNKYETRTMAWYGPDNGAYYSELIRKTIELCAL